MGVLRMLGLYMDAPMLPGCRNKESIISNWEEYKQVLCTVVSNAIGISEGASWWQLQSSCSVCVVIIGLHAQIQLLSGRACFNCPYRAVYFTSSRKIKRSRK